MKARWMPMISTIAVAALTMPSAWASYFCNGVIDSVGVNPDGTVQIDSSSAGLRYAKVCTLSGPMDNGIYSISADVCKGILATVLRAQATGATVQWGFMDNITCSQHVAWQPLTGLYYGPIILNQ